MVTAARSSASERSTTGTLIANSRSMAAASFAGRAAAAAALASKTTLPLWM